MARKYEYCSSSRSSISQFRLKFRADRKANEVFPLDVSAGPAVGGKKLCRTNLFNAQLKDIITSVTLITFLNSCCIIRLSNECGCGSVNV